MRACVCVCVRVCLFVGVHLIEWQAVLLISSPPSDLVLICVVNLMKAMMQSVWFRLAL